MDDAYALVSKIVGAGIG